MKHTVLATILARVKGEAKTDVVCGRVEDVFQTYRSLYKKGIKKNEVNIIRKRLQVMSPEGATKISEVQGQKSQMERRHQVLERDGKD